MKNKFLHIGLWVFMLLFIFDYHWYEDTFWWQALGYAFAEILSYVGIFYLNYYLLEHFYTENKWVPYAAALITIVLYALAFQLLGWEDYFYEAAGWRNLFSILLNASLFTGIAWLTFFSNRGQQLEQRNLALMAANKQLEIDTLKSKINPHFLFNTLNNLNALLLTQQEQAPAVVSRLSNVLRYGLDVGDQSMISLEKEIAYLKDYIALVLLQQPASTNIDLYVEGLVKDIKIPPFLLTTFLENAVKYGDIQHNDKGFLHLHIEVAANHLFFEIKNSTDSQLIKGHGTGLLTIKKQLDLQFGKKYRLEQIKEDAIFTIQLELPLRSE